MIKVIKIDHYNSINQEGHYRELDKLLASGYTLIGNTTNGTNERFTLHKPDAVYVNPETEIARLRESLSAAQDEIRELRRITTPDIVSILRFVAGIVNTPVQLSASREMTQK